MANNDPVWEGACSRCTGWRAEDMANVSASREQAPSHQTPYATVIVPTLRVGMQTVTLRVTLGPQSGRTGISTLRVGTIMMANNDPLWEGACSRCTGWRTEDMRNERATREQAPSHQTPYATLLTSFETR